MTLFVGLTGTNCAGKGTFARLASSLVPSSIFSLSDEVRQECRDLGLEISRENLIRIGNELRRKEGAGIFAERVAEKALAVKGKKLVFIDSVRAVGEVEALRRLLGEKFVLVSVDAPLRTRYERALARKREGEQELTFEKFKELEEKELESKNSSGQSLVDCVALADLRVDNSGSVEGLGAQVEQFLKSRGII